jgi:hypothetical protein
MIADPNAAEHLGSGSDHDVVADCRVPLTLLIARPAERYALVDQNVVTDFRGFANHYAHAVIDEKPAADRRARMDFNSGKKPRYLRYKPGKKRDILLVKPVSQPVEEDRMKARIAEDDLDDAFGSRVFAKNSIDLFPDRAKHGRTLPRVLH